MSFLKKVGKWKTVNGRHSKLPEEIALQNNRNEEDDEQVEIENDVLTFKLKYLGSSIIEKMLSENMNQEAVHDIVKRWKGTKKPTRVVMQVSLRGLHVSDQQTGTEILRVSIYRISKCSTNSTYRTIFSFLSTDPDETTKCHVFLCPKRKQAETVALAVAHSFTLAYEAWRILPSTLEYQQKAIEKERRAAMGERETLEKQIVDQLVQLDNSNRDWVSFEDNFNVPGPGIDLILS